MAANAQRLSIGVEGLDHVLNGGLIAGRSYLVRGEPGRGKTTLGLHFLTADGGDRSLYIGFQESEQQLRANAAAIGIDLAGVDILSLAPDERFFAGQEGYDVFAASEVEHGPIVDAIVARVEEQKPGRVFVDSLTQLRFLSSDLFQYRKQVLSFLRFVTDRGATVMFSSESSEELPDNDLQFIADGVIHLESSSSGAVARISKYRGSDFRRGGHHMRVTGDGLRAFPHMIPPRTDLSDTDLRQLGCGIEGLDTMLHGGLEQGTIALVTGPSGVGKSTVATAFAANAARSGSRAAMFLFEEEMAMLRHRSTKLGIPLEEALSSGRLSVEQIEPMRYLVDEFAMRVQEHVQSEGVELVVIDSISGFELAMEGESVQQRLHAFAKGLSRLGVTVVLVNETDGLTTTHHVSERDISYLSDNVIYLRYRATDGAYQKVIGVLKKRMSGFDTQARALEIAPGALRLGDVVH